MALTLGLPPDSFAHHSRSRFNQSELVEIEGELTIFSWRNPHVRIQVKTTDNSGNDVLWNMEGDSLSILRRTSAKPEGIEIGSRVKVAGYGTIRPSNDMLAYNLLTSDGREVLVNIKANPRWSDDVSGGIGVWATDGTVEQERGDIFRVWSTSLGGERSFGQFWPESYPLTESARATHSTWDPSVDVVATGCEPKGMPHIMEQPYPMEFVREGDNVLLRIEEYDTVRTIFINSDIAPEKSILGHSTGHWEGDTLVVATGNVTYRYFDDNGTPQGSNASFVERFRVSDDNSRLEYALIAVDDEIFTEPVNLNKHWLWRPGEQVEPYDCVD
ncbi:MAG: DUF6152 family protein [Bacteroidetes bacterium]|nr:DUF6152 family protein [Bacteroidota bacterium]